MLKLIEITSKAIKETKGFKDDDVYELEGFSQEEIKMQE